MSLNRDAMAGIAAIETAISSHISGAAKRHRPILSLIRDGIGGAAMSHRNWEIHVAH